MKQDNRRPVVSMKPLVLLSVWLLAGALQSPQASAAFLIVYFKEIGQTAPEQYVLISDNLAAGQVVTAPGLFNGFTTTHADSNATVGDIAIASEINYLSGWTIEASLTVATFSDPSPSEGVFLAFDVTRTADSTETLEVFATRGFDTIAATTDSFLYGGGQVTDTVAATAFDFDGGIDVGGDAFNMSTGTVTMAPTYDGAPLNGLQDYNFSNANPPQANIPEGAVSLTVGTTVTLAQDEFFGTQMTFEAVNLSALNAVPEPGSVALVLTAIAAGGGVPAWKRCRKRPASKKCDRRQPKVSNQEGDVSTAI